MFKVMALNDSEGGDIGYLYFSNLETPITKVKDLPTIQEKLVFTELNALTILGVSNLM